MTEVKSINCQVEYYRLHIYISLIMFGNSFSIINIKMEFPADQIFIFDQFYILFVNLNNFLNFIFSFITTRINKTIL